MTKTTTTTMLHVYHQMGCEKRLKLRGQGGWYRYREEWCALIGFGPHSSTYARVALQQPNDGRVSFRPVDELLQRQPPVLVGVHLSEDLLRSFLRRRFVLGHLHHRANHPVDRPDDFQHLLFRNESVPIEIVHVERPA